MSGTFNLRCLLSCLLVLGQAGPLAQAAPTVLPNTEPLTETGDLANLMREGLHRFLADLTERSLTNRPRYWQREFTTVEAYAASVQTNRSRLARLVGAVDARPNRANLELIGAPGQPSALAESALCSAYAVRWTAFGDVHAEGLLLRPKNGTHARVVVLPDADQVPESLAALNAPAVSSAARRLAEAGCEVLIPVLINRDQTWSGSESLDRWTDQPHREWIYRQAFTVGRHIIGYEVQKVLAAIDWFSQQPAPVPIGVLGYGEGGLIAFYSSALDPRIDVTLLSGYFQARENLWNEPIYRNVFGLLREFGDAEIASLVAPRRLLIEHSEVPSNPRPKNGQSEGSNTASLQTPGQWLVESELIRLAEFFPPAFRPRTRLFNGSEGTTVSAGSRLALLEFLRALEIDPANLNTGRLSPWRQDWTVDSTERQHRQFRELEQHTQGLLDQAEAERARFFWAKLAGPESAAAQSQLRRTFERELIGRIDLPFEAPRPRSRFWRETASWTAYELRLEVWPEVFAWGLLLIPKGDVEPRPVVVCQHGLEGLPGDTIDADPSTAGHRYYQAFAAKLADRGYVVFAPHNPYRGGDDFRTLQRRANPLGLSLYSIILGQHEQILAWLASQPFVDPARIGFYGLSYGGKSALYLPAVIDRYALSICSANFNDWARKLADTRSPFSYMFTGEYEMPEFNLANTFSHAELAALIAPRPFMVERGHDDGVAPDEWVAYEYAKVRRHYDSLNLADRTRIAYFPGGHRIHGVETFEFLDRFLRSNR